MKKKHKTTERGWASNNMSDQSSKSSSEHGDPGAGELVVGEGDRLPDGVEELADGTFRVNGLPFPDRTLAIAYHRKRVVSNAEARPYVPTEQEKIERLADGTFRVNGLPFPDETLAAGYARSRSASLKRTAVKRQMDMERFRISPETKLGRVMIAGKGEVQTRRQIELYERKITIERLVQIGIITAIEHVEAPEAQGAMA